MGITYNRELAVEYAREWAYLRNPAYYNFDSLGGDCTNFVSQCLIAGGMPMNYQPIFGWYYVNLKTRSAAFTGVEYLYNFLTRQNKSRGPVAVILEIDKLLPGDIIQLSFDGTTFTHSLIVVEQGSDPLIAAHSHEAFGRALSSYTFAAARGLHILGAYS